MKISQPTISQANSRIASRLTIVLAAVRSHGGGPRSGHAYIYDGTLLSCWSWRDDSSKKLMRHCVT